MTIINYGISNSMILLSKAHLSERIKLGALNTVLGMGIVFVVLTLIIFIISLFKYLPNPTSGEKSVKKDQDDRTASVDNKVTQIERLEEADLMNDHELVAVITAAIHAYQSDNFIRSFSRWFYRPLHSKNK